MTDTVSEALPCKLCYTTSIRHSPTAQKSWLYRRRGNQARSLHRREHGDLQRRGMGCVGNGWCEPRRLWPHLRNVLGPLEGYLRHIHGHIRVSHLLQEQRHANPCKRGVIAGADDYFCNRQERTPALYPAGVDNGRYRASIVFLCLNRTSLNSENFSS